MALRSAPSLIFLFSGLFIFALSFGSAARDLHAASLYEMDDEGEDAADQALPPPSRAMLENIPKTDIFEEDRDAGLPFDIRGDALKEAAISYGARGGLAWRTYWINKELKANAHYMDKVFDFRQLLIPAPSGLLIEPPIVSEAINAIIIESNGETAAVSDRIYDINANAKIVTAARQWRSYLEHDWGAVAEPPDILRPANNEERKKWIKWVREGWDEGVKQANDVFEQDLNRLNADFQGMVRYRMLLAQGMISAPYTTMIDRGITGDGDTMRIGDRAVQITGKPSLIVESDAWQPADR